MRGLHVATFESGAVIYVGPQHYFTDLTPEQMNVQLGLKRDYDRWIERVRLLLSSAPKRLEADIKKADDACRRWIELSSNWSIRPNPNHNVQHLRGDFAGAAELLNILGPDDGRIFVVPDTNSLLASANPTIYRMPAGRDEFFFVLTPTVLRELDELKVLHRNPDVREKAQKAVTRIKGWRNQGNLLNGVVVDRTITVTAIAEEPQMQATLSWLDPTNADDRIIASVLLIEAKFPASQVLLVTGDINLQNKADAAQVSTAELP